MTTEQQNGNGGDEGEEPLYKKFLDQKYPSTPAQENSGRHGSNLDILKRLRKSSPDPSHQNCNGRDSTGDQAIQGTLLNNQAASIGRVDRKVSSRKAAGDESKAHGFDYEILWLERQLLKPEINKDQIKAFGIVGIAGVGKTRLCQEIFDSPEVKKQFLPRIWVSMAWKPGEDDNPKVAFLERILGCLGVVINDIPGDEKIAVLEYTLHLELIGKRYLIVLDDVREEDKFREKLENCYGFPKGVEGAVLVTSRSEGLAKEMVGEENLHRVLPLSDMNHCWGIYKDMVEIDKTPRLPDSDELKEELLRKCNGLPLAAKLMGQIKFRELRQRQQQQQQQRQEQQQQPPVNG
ncbi:hypothetical protein HS088_TW15G01335 [Tripterygium wilfordii]|uniref:NB-ARC domain-containing protein n=1 Tax=Tripterygium wilfordii TaxID=458696 RepID=A0A7J7CPC7_TRIWF|nr:probable disease resistance protein At4g19060 [Tripterygium wilfordii]KAF5735819.1 hypothetical protein HS088_TW15G01335 [Tripterygium wilfordii]